MAAVALPARPGLGALNPWAGAAALVALALVVRVLFFVGYQGHDDRSYIAYAWGFAHGVDFAAAGIADPWVARLGAWLPMSLLMRAFGNSEAAYVAWSLLCSLASVGLAYWAGRWLFATRAGWLAASGVALLPIDVLYATRAFGDEATGAWCFAALLLLLRSLRSPQRRWPLAAGLAWGMAYLGKETALLMALPFALILLQWPAPSAQRRRLALLLSGGLALLVAAELVFWQSATGDALYRWHSTLGARGGFVPPPKVVTSWLDHIPSAIPSEVFRSQNTLIDALAMVTTNEEWGLLFYAALPLAAVALWRGPAGERALATFVVCMLLLLLFLPLHFPHYTLGRDPRHFTMLNGPAVLLVAAFVSRLERRGAIAVGGLLAASWLAGLLVGYVSSDIGTQRRFAERVAQPGSERIWTNSVLAADATVLAGFRAELPLGIVRFSGSRVADGTGLVPSNALRALRRETPVATSLQQLQGQIVALPDHVRPEPGWTPLETIAAPPSTLADGLRNGLLRMGVPQQLAAKVAPSHGATIRLYRVTGTPR